MTAADGPPGEDGKRRRVVVWQTGGKTDAAGRTIALDDETVKVLREHRTRQLAERMACRGSGHAITATSCSVTRTAVRSIRSGSVRGTSRSSAALAALAAWATTTTGAYSATTWTPTGPGGDHEQ